MATRGKRACSARSAGLLIQVRYCDDFAQTKGCLYSPRVQSYPLYVSVRYTAFCAGSVTSILLI